MAQIWATNSLGGFLYSDQLSTTLRHALQPMQRFRQFCDAKDASKKAKKTGDLFTWDVFSNIATGGGTLVETNTMPESQFTITQATLTVTERGNSVPFSQKLDNLSKLPVETIIREVLANDAAKAMDTAAHAQFNLTPLVAHAATASTVTVSTASTPGSATSAMRKAHVVAIVDAMRERNIPGYRQDDYICVAHPTTVSTLYTDIESVSQYVDTGYQKILRGEIGRYYGCRFVTQTHIAKSSWTKTDWAFFFGQGTCGEGVVVREEMRGKIPTDYGRSKGVAWYALNGFGITHNDTATGVPQARILKWASSS